MGTFGILVIGLLLISGATAANHDESSNINRPGTSSANTNRPGSRPKTSYHQLLGPARVLLLPYPGLNHSESSSMASLGEEMAGRGHEVYLLVGDDYYFRDLENLGEQGITPIQYITGRASGHSQHYQSSANRMNEWDSKASNGGGGSHRGYGGSGMRRGEDEQSQQFQPFDKFTRRQAKQWKQFCNQILSDHDLFQKLRRMNFDLVVVNSDPVCRCQLVIPYRLGLPHVSMVQHSEPWLQGNPHMPSFVPFIYGSADYSDQMSFWERFYNMWSLASWSYDPQIETHEEDYLTRFIPDKAPKHADDIAKDSILWFMESNMVLEYPRPNMPNVIDIGGVTAYPGNYKKLPAEIQSVMENVRGESGGNVVVVDLGREYSIDGGHKMSNMPYDIEDRLMTAFKQTRYQFIWRNPQHGDLRYSMKYSDGNRIRMVSWLPRNDVLAHPNVRLYITDGNTNGQYEALYHGVPSLIVHSHGGQKYAGRRVEHRGYGLTLDAHSFSTADALEAIEEILHNSTFSHNLQRAASFFRQSRDQHPAELAADWLENVLTHDDVDSYLRSHGQQLSQSSYSLMDLACFLVFGHLVVIWVSYKLMTAFCRRLFCSRRRSHGRRHHDDDDEDDECDSSSGFMATSGSGSGTGGGYRHRSGGGRHRKH